MKKPKEIVAQFIQSTNERDWVKAKALLHEKVQRHSSTYGVKPVLNRGHLIDFHKEEVIVFPDSRETIDFMVEEGDMVAARIHFLGSQLGMLGQFPPSDKILDAYFNCFFKVLDNMIVEIWVEYDQLNSLIQLGHYNS